MVTDAWLPAELAGTLTSSALRHEPLYELLSAAGVIVDRMQHEITAEIAGPRTAHLLDVAIGAALLRGQPSCLGGRFAPSPRVDPVVAQLQSCVDEPDGRRTENEGRLADHPRPASWVGLADQSHAGDEPPGAGQVCAIGIAVLAPQIRLLDAAHL